MEEFEVDGSTSCLFCRNQIGVMKSADLNEEPGGAGGGGGGGLVVALRMLFRYLNINISEMTLYSQYLKTKVNNSSSSGVGVLEALTSSLCVSCSALATNFWQVYQDFEMARMLLAEILLSVSERLRLRGCTSKVGEGVDRGATGERLSDVVFAQCRRKLQSVPRVAVRDTGGQQPECIGGVENDDSDSWNHSDDISQKSVPPHYHPENSIKKLEKQQPVVTCVHCQHVSGDASQHQHHVLRSHPVEFFAEDLPPGTTPQQLEIAIGRLGRASDEHADDDDDNQQNQCILCGLSCATGFEWRIHVLQSHWESILANLESSSSSNTPSTPPPTFKIRGPKPKKSKFRSSKAEQARSKCLYCGYISSNITHNHTHMMTRHPSLYFKSQLPAHVTSDQQVEKAISNIFKQGLILPTHDKYLFECSICGGEPARAPSRKVHLLRAHVDLLIAKLGGGAAAPMPDRSAGRRQGLKCHICGKMSTNKRSFSLHQSLHQSLSGQSEGAKERVTCPYCGLVFRDPNVNLTHQMCKHTSQYISNNNKSGVDPNLSGIVISETTVKNAIQRVIKEGRIESTEVNQQFYCFMCSKLCSAPSKKIHALYKHLPEVIRQLKSSPPPPSSSTIGERETSIVSSAMIPAADIGTGGGGGDDESEPVLESQYQFVGKTDIDSFREGDEEEEEDLFQNSDFEFETVGECHNNQYSDYFPPNPLEDSSSYYDV